MMHTVYDYWLCSIPGVGDRTIARLLDWCGSPEAIYTAKHEDLAAVLKPGQLAALEQLRSRWNLQEEYEKLQKGGIFFLTREDDEYPMRLRNIPDPPYGLFVRGSLPKEGDMSVAVIGARDCSAYGKFVAGELGSFLGQNGIQVISGMARGIDGISQEEALKAGGTTTAVLGCGVDICYPEQNRELYEQILEKGCILSAYPPGTQPRPQNFPPRNRIVSGLADAVVVIEARNKSGTLITVDMALEQGKEVYVVPGRITDRLSDGCNRLMKQGAGILLSPADFLEELQGQRVSVERVRAGSSEKDNPVMILPEDLQQIYQLLDFMPLPVEGLLEKLPQEYTVSMVNTKLMRLCMMGLAAQETPGYFSRK